MIHKAQNYSAYSELLSVFRITPRIQNYSAYSLFTRASRKASPERFTFRPPVGVLSAYHALILVENWVSHSQNHEGGVTDYSP